MSDQALLHAGLIRSSVDLCLSSCAVIWAGDLAEVYYGANHPMKPHRMCMAHSLILGYGLHEKMEVYVRPEARRMTCFIYSDRAHVLDMDAWRANPYVHTLSQHCLTSQ